MTDTPATNAELVLITGATRRTGIHTVRFLLDQG
jgi:hypothetical protein